MCGKSGRRIDQSRLNARLAASLFACNLEIVHETSSTNADLMARMRASGRLTQPIVRIAYQQTAGRGRQGRRWWAKAGDALLFSMAASLPRPVHALAGLSLAAGAAVLTGLRALPLTEPHRLRLKWPNDLLLDDAKLGGILIETLQPTRDSSIAVIGVGLNLDGENMLAAQMGTSAHRPAALTRILAEVDMTEVLGHVLDALAAMLKVFGTQGFAPFKPLWCAHHAYTGCDVILLEQQQEVARGRLIGVDVCGRLKIDTASGVRTLSNGALSLRLQHEETSKRM